MVEPNWILFGDFVSARRKEIPGLTVQALAEKLEVSAVTIYKIESGARPLSEKLVDPLANALSLKPAELKSRMPKRKILNDSIKEGRANSKLRKQVTEQAQLLDMEDARRRADLVDAQQQFRNETLEPFLEACGNVNGLDAPLRQYESPDIRAGASTANGQQFQQRLHVVAKALTDFAASLAAGTTMGGVSAFGAYAGVAALATASTGTPIAVLSGAAASSATLAALGGGSLAAGGWGMVGGTALLTGMVALPTVILGGMGAVAADRRAYAALLSEGAALDQIAEKLLAIEADLELRWEWATMQSEILRLLRVAAAAPLFRFTSQTSKGRVDWDTLRQQYGKAEADLNVLVQVLALGLEAMSLPTWTPVFAADTNPELAPLAIEADVRGRYRDLDAQARTLATNAG